MGKKLNYTKRVNPTPEHTFRRTCQGDSFKMPDENPTTVCNYGHLANHILLICSWDGGAPRPPIRHCNHFPAGCQPGLSSRMFVIRTLIWIWQYNQQPNWTVKLNSVVEHHTGRFYAMAAENDCATMSVCHNEPPSVCGGGGGYGVVGVGGAHNRGKTLNCLRFLSRVIRTNSFFLSIWLNAEKALSQIIKCRVLNHFHNANNKSLTAIIVDLSLVSTLSWSALWTIWSTSLKHYAWGRNKTWTGHQRRCELTMLYAVLLYCHCTYSLIHQRCYSVKARASNWTIWELTGSHSTAILKCSSRLKSI